MLSSGKIVSPSAMTVVTSTTVMPSVALTSTVGPVGAGAMTYRLSNGMGGVYKMALPLQGTAERSAIISTTDNGTTAIPIGTPADALMNLIKPSGRTGGGAASLFEGLSGAGITAVKEQVLARMEALNGASDENQIPDGPVEGGNGNGDNGDPPGTDRSYQFEARGATVKHYLDDHNRGVIVLPTGTGKTKIFGGIAADVISDLDLAAIDKDGRLADIRDKKVLVLTHRQEILDQTVKRLEKVFGNSEVTTIQEGSRKDASGKVVVAMIPTLTAGGIRSLSLINPDEFGLVIVDEAHHIMADTWLEVVAHLGFIDAGGRPQKTRGKLLVGVTATPDRYDCKYIADIFGQDGLIYSRPMTWFIENGWLLHPNGIHVSAGRTADLRGLATGEDGDFSADDLARRVNVDARNAVVAEAYRKHAMGKKALVFAASVGHAKALAAMFNEKFKDDGIKAAVVYHGMDPDERKRVVSDFREGKIQVLTNFGILTEGYDDPGIEVIINSRPTQSRSLYVQMVGRGLRPDPEHPERGTVLIIDITDKINGQPFQMDLAALFGTHYTENGKEFDPLDELGRQKAHARDREGEVATDAGFMDIRYRFMDLTGMQGRMGKYLQKVLHEKYNGDITRFAWGLRLQEDMLTRYIFRELPPTEKELLQVFTFAFSAGIIDRRRMVSYWRFDTEKRWFDRIMEKATDIYNKAPLVPMSNFLDGLCKSAGVAEPSDIFGRMSAAERLGVDVSAFNALLARYSTGNLTDEEAGEDMERLVSEGRTLGVGLELFLARVFNSRRPYHFVAKLKAAKNEMNKSHILALFRAQGLNTDELEKLLSALRRRQLLAGMPPNIEDLHTAMLRAEEMMSFGDEADFWYSFRNVIELNRTNGRCLPMFAGGDLSGYILPVPYGGRDFNFGRLLAETLYVYGEHPLVADIMRLCRMYNLKISHPHSLSQAMGRAASALEGWIEQEALGEGKNFISRAAFAAKAEETLREKGRDVARKFEEFGVKHFRHFFSSNEAIMTKLASKMKKKLLGDMRCDFDTDGFTYEKYLSNAAGAFGISRDEYVEWVQFFKENRIDFEYGVLSAARDKLIYRIRAAETWFPFGEFEERVLSEIGLSKNDANKWDSVFKAGGHPPLFGSFSELKFKRFENLIERAESCSKPRSREDAIAQMALMTGNFIGLGTWGPGLSRDDIGQWFEGLKEQDVEDLPNVRTWNMRWEDDRINGVLGALVKKAGRSYGTTELYLAAVKAAYSDPSFKVEDLERRFEEATGLGYDEFKQFLRDTGSLRRLTRGPEVADLKRLEEIEMDLAASATADEKFEKFEEAAAKTRLEIARSGDLRKIAELVQRNIALARKIFGVDSGEEIIFKLQGFRDAGYEVGDIEVLVFTELGVKRPTDYEGGSVDTPLPAPADGEKSFGSASSARHVDIRQIPMILEGAHDSLFALHRARPDAQAGELAGMVEKETGFDLGEAGELADRYKSAWRKGGMSIGLVEGRAARISLILSLHRGPAFLAGILREILSRAVSKAEREGFVSIQRRESIQKQAEEESGWPLTVLHERLDAARSAAGADTKEIDAILEREGLDRAAVEGRAAEAKAALPKIEAVAGKRPQRPWLDSDNQAELERQEKALTDTDLTGLDPTKRTLLPKRLDKVRDFLDNPQASVSTLPRFLEVNGDFIDNL